VSSLSWLLQIAGLCVVPMALMAGLAQGDAVPGTLPTLELRVLGLGAGCFLLGRWLGRKDG
jgi:hypothetical protein